MVTCSSILAWRNPMDRGAWWLQSMGLQIVLHDWETGYARKRTHTNTHTHTHTRQIYILGTMCRYEGWPERELSDLEIAGIQMVCVN